MATIVLPVAAIFSTRSSVLLLSLASASLLLGRMMRPGGTAEVVQEAGSLLRAPLTLTLIAFVIAAFASAGWAAYPSTTLQYAVRLLGNVVLGIAFALAISGESRERVLRFLLVGLALALPLLLNELRGYPLRPLLGARPGADAINRTVLNTGMFATTSVVLAFVGRKYRLPASVFCAVAALLAFVSPSQSSALYWVAAGLALPVAILFPRVAARALAAASVALVMLFPFFVIHLGNVLKAILSNSGSGFVRESNALARLEIWSQAAPAILDRFFLGWGFAAERPSNLPIPETGLTGPIGQGHPHDLAIQVWLDLGLLGFVLVAAVFLATARLFLKSDPERLPGAVALAAGVFAVWMVSHGAYQEWWLALISIVFCLLLRTSDGVRKGLAGTGR
ncbi:O-antigen ligase [Afifella sp. IM 167]|uniref:O-antigen ligase family protein n=1 Tax=Afifella sp. IM 167 TaxID=2033586 RepID=UPI001CCD945D|nr:O-antigen ligase family protein [Afifella sp. IM 167]